MKETSVPIPIGSQQAYARLAGFMYFVVLVFDIAGLVIASIVSGQVSFLETSQRIASSETLYRLGLCAGLVGSLATIPLAVGLYVAVRPVDSNLAIMALLFRTSEAAIGATAVGLSFTAMQIHLAANQANAFTTNQLGALAGLSSGVPTEIPAIFFSVGSTLFFYLLLKSRYIPPLVSSWGIFASVLYAVAWLVSLTLPHYAGAVVAISSVPILLAEVSTGLWLLTRGLR